MQTVKMYTTAYCGYCTRAKQLLAARGVEVLDEIRIDEHPQERKHMMELTGRRTVPQIFIDGLHVGDCDELHDLDAQGKLDPMLAGK